MVTWGSRLGGDGVRAFRHRVLRAALFARRGGGGLLSGHRLLPDALVSAIVAGRALGVFYFGAPLAFIFGAPLSGLLLDLHGALGFDGWQWLFLVEGLLASIVGVWAFWYLDDDPAKARWLTHEQRASLVARLADDSRFASSHGPRSVLAALVDPRVLVLCCVYFLIQAAVYGVVFYLPQQVSALLGTKVGFHIGLVTALPWIAAMIVTWMVPRYADRTGKHRACAVALLVMAGVAIAVSGLAGMPIVSLLALCCAASGFIAVQPLFWTFPTRYLTSAAAAAGIALINSLGGLGGFFAPMGSHRRRSLVQFDERRTHGAGRREGAGGAGHRSDGARAATHADGGRRARQSVLTNHMETRTCPCLRFARCAPSPSAAAAPIITTRAPTTGSTITSPRRWPAPEYRKSRQSFGLNVLGSLVVEIEASDGTVGFAMTTGGEIGAFIVEKHFARFVEGQRVTDIEKMWDQMFNATLYYGRKGIVLNAISGVDLALWDLLAKVRREPVFQLLGGPVRDELQFYATGARPDLAKQMGFIGGKMPLQHGPAEGEEGLAANIAKLADMRSKVGDDFWLMFDCWMSLDLNYARHLANAAREYGLKWLEEALPPDDYWGYAELRRSVPNGRMVTTGEHEATRWGLSHAVRNGLCGSRAARCRLVRRHHGTHQDLGARGRAQRARRAAWIVGLTAITSS